MVRLLRGFYTAASGMIAQQRQQEALSNNVANVNTPGYKADQAVMRSFPELLIRQMGSQTIGTENGTVRSLTNQPIGSLNTGVFMQEAIPNFSQGPIRETNMATDMALVDGALPDETGALFFMVEEDGAIRYTRNGHFTIDHEGYLTTNDGHYILDENENRIQPNGLDFNVSANGLLQGTGVNTNLGIAYVANAHELTKGNGDLLQLTGNAENARQLGLDFTVLQKTLEGSNVDPTKSMTDMMSAYRMFEQNQHVLKTYDESMGKAVNEIARLG